MITATVTVVRAPTENLDAIAFARSAALDGEVIFYPSAWGHDQEPTVGQRITIGGVTKVTNPNWHRPRWRSADVYPAPSAIGPRPPGEQPSSTHSKSWIARLLGLIGIGNRPRITG